MDAKVEVIANRDRQRMQAAEPEGLEPRSADDVAFPDVSVSATREACAEVLAAIGLRNFFGA